nr:protein kinase-like domain-containing protein [Tanacetum cinerariifolium]
MLVIYDNKLTGGIPRFLGNITSMETFSASWNPLGGSIPDILGPIPDAIGNLSLVTKLCLNSNKLEGHIPSSLGSCKELNGLNLADNRLNTWKSFEFLNISFNDFEGEVPVVGVFSNASAFLVLGNDRLCGGLVTLELPKCKEKGRKKKRVPFFIFVIVILPMLLIILCCVYLLCKKKRNSQQSQSSGNETFLKVSYNELLKATDGFSIANLISECGLSSVYKGILKSNDDKFVAVKVLHLQNRGAYRSFLVECEAWRNIRHRNLLKIITACSSVDFQRNDFKASVINILKDVATALDYLHNRCQTTIVHGDLKPSNILLDADMVAYVGDFGLARLLGTDLKQNSSIGVKGTIGYAPQEYSIGSEMTNSGDIYSFGILLLEVMTGKNPTDGMFNEGLSLHKY